MARIERNFRTKVLVSMKGGAKCSTPFYIWGKNKDERLKAEAKAIASIRRMICEEGHDFLCSYFKDEVIKKKR